MTDRYALTEESAARIREAAGSAEYAILAASNGLDLTDGHRILVVELGIGARNQAIKLPLMRLVAREPQTTYVTFNYAEVNIPRNIASRSVGVSGDLGEALAQIVPAA